jgi:hypothetical protein
MVIFTYAQVGTHHEIRSCTAVNFFGKGKSMRQVIGVRTAGVYFFTLQEL